MEILISLAAKTVENTVKAIGHQLGYQYFYDRNIKHLVKQVEMLKETKESVQQMVSSARRNTEDIKSDVQNWLSKVDKIIEEYEVILLINEGQGSNTCSSKLCLNFVQRHRLSKKAKKMADKVLEMKKEGNFGSVSYNIARLGFASPTKTSDFLSFESRKSTMEQIMDALGCDNVNRIGVYGMGGVGKTMLVKEILRRVKEEKSFDEVVMLTVSQTPDLKRIQGQLGDILDLKFEQETMVGRAMKLCKRLKMEKKILVVLDDIWEHIDLETIGIPSDVDHEGCKILYSSRDKHILSNDICTDKNFEVKILQQDEPWNLFKQVAGEIVEASNLKPIADQIVKECAQLPIAITTVAKALRNKPLSIWRDASYQLKNPVAVNIRGMNEKVYCSLKLSYEQLECKEAKLLFLLCSMFPEAFLINVENLHMYAMGMGLLHGVDTMAQGRLRITKLIDDLISSSLLIESESKINYVKMHDMIRDVAILIASKDDRIHLLSYVKGNEWQEEKMSGNYTVVYLHFEGLHNPPKKLVLPKVQLLMLYGPLSDGHELSETFFEEMKELKVLELECMKILMLPPSFYSLTSLRSLHLRNCELENIYMIGELKKLEVLSFKGSDIAELPGAISQLTQLKMLDLSSCHQLKVIPPNILSRLTKLEELDLDDSFVAWEDEKLNRQRKNASLVELKYLSRLSALSICIQNEKVMPGQLFSRELNLERFKINIGRKWGHYESTTSRMLYLNMKSGNPLHEWIKVLLKKSEELYLVGSSGSRALRFELDEKFSSHLKHLYLLGNSEIQHFIHENERPSWNAFSILESLSLSELGNLENIIHYQVKNFPLNKFRVVRVEQCMKLRNLFFNSIMKDLLTLEKIEISYCEIMEVIIVMGIEEATDEIELTHLNSLELNHLPRLESFCSIIKKLDNSEKGGCDNPFFSSQVSLPNLEYLKISCTNNLKMICHNVLIPNSFVKLKRVEIDCCDNLQKVFPSNIMNTLKCLTHLKIESCNLLEGIFEAEETNGTIKEKVLMLPQLSSLELFDLPNLEYMWSKDPRELVVFENLQDLSIRQCSKLKRVYPVKILQQFEWLDIEYGKLMEILGKEKSVKILEMDRSDSSKVEIRELRDDLELFPKLKTLNLLGSLDDKCTHLPVEVVRILHNLEELKVRETFFEEIFPNERSIEVAEHQHHASICYPLRNLTLFKLPKLRHLWKESSQNNSSSLQKLQYLSIGRCGRLSFLASSWISSFKNLRSLTIFKCDGLTHLLNPRVAAILVRLTRMSLRGCKRIATVIAQGEGGDEEDNEIIVFNNLKDLTLRDLPRLTSFHSGKCIIRFPRLDSMDIRNCPEMKVFSLGILSMPCLEAEGIKLYRDDQHFIPTDSEMMSIKNINAIVREAWENDYDSGIRHLFAQQNLEEN